MVRKAKEVTGEIAAHKMRWPDGMVHAHSADGQPIGFVMPGRTGHGFSAFRYVKHGRALSVVRLRKTYRRSATAVRALERGHAK